MELNRERIADILDIIFNKPAAMGMFAITTSQAIMLLSLINELLDENERLQAEIDNGVEVCHNCHTEYADKIEQAKADTVRKMQSEIEAQCIKGGIYPAFVKNTVNKVTEEILKENQNEI